MKPVILMRPSLAEENEEAIAKRYFPVYRSRTEIPKDSLVIGRYSVLPYYNELEADLKFIGSKLINSYQDHRWIADMREWYEDFRELTPNTWFRLQDVPPAAAPYVLKGATNSKKFNWNTHMYAEDRTAAMQVHSRLTQDGLIGDQDIYIRKYVPLKKISEGLNGLPITEEYRFFFLDGDIIASGFYWASHLDDLDVETVRGLTPSNVPFSFIQKVSKALKENAVRFVVVDIARTADNNWIVIELNDGQMSGLSCVDPDYLYSQLANFLK